MIDYSRDRLCNTWRLMGSVLPRAVPAAFASAMICGALIGTIEGLQWGIGPPELGTSAGEQIFEIMSNPYVHQVSMLFISFVTAFRVSMAYNRFWEGATAVYGMREKWLNAVLQLVAFDEKAPARGSIPGFGDAHSVFRAQLAHLVSLMHAVSVLEIKQHWNVECLNPSAHQRNEGDELRAASAALCPQFRALLLTSAHRTRMLCIKVLGAPDALELKELEGVTHGAWVQMVALRVHRLVVTRSKAGGLDVPPPVLARAIAALTEGVDACMHAQKIAAMPFPYPLYEMMRYMKLYFLATAPLVMISFTNIWAVAVGASFASTLVLAALLEVAEELEQPFGEDANDLPLLDLHRDFNHAVLHLTTLPCMPLDVRPGGTANQEQKAFAQRIETEVFGRAMQEKLRGTVDPARKSIASMSVVKGGGTLMRLDPLQVRL